MKYDHVVVAYGKYYAPAAEAPETAPRATDIFFETDAIVSETTSSPKRGRPAKKTAD